MLLLALGLPLLAYIAIDAAANRYLLHDRLQMAFQQSAREHKQLDVLYLDVHAFK